MKDKPWVTKTFNEALEVMKAQGAEIIEDAVYPVWKDGLNREYGDKWKFAQRVELCSSECTFSGFYCIKFGLIGDCKVSTTFSRPLRSTLTIYPRWKMYYGILGKRQLRNTRRMGRKNLKKQRQQAMLIGKISQATMSPTKSD
jgi:hypothetical protein